MALIVEDGTGLDNAESYVSVVDCGTYCTAHALSAWTGTDAAKESALRNATQYIDTNYSFKYEKTYVEQALEFPRYYWDWDDALMNRLRSACCELAVKALSGSLFVDADPSVTIKVKVGPIEKTTRPSEQSGQVRYKQVDALLKQLITGGGSVAVIRA
jgi:hypothetical protein